MVITDCITSRMILTEIVVSFAGVPEVNDISKEQIQRDYFYRHLVSVCYVPGPV